MTLILTENAKASGVKEGFGSKSELLLSSTVRINMGVNIPQSDWLVKRYGKIHLPTAQLPLYYGWANWSLKGENHDHEIYPPEKHCVGWS